MTDPRMLPEVVDSARGEMEAEQNPEMTRTTVNPCPITPATDVIFAKWTTQVLWALTQDGRLRFSELRQRLEAVSPKVLTQRLRQLERDGLVARVDRPGAHGRVEYAATELALSLGPVFAVLERWSQEHFEEIAAARAGYTGPLAA